MADRFEIDRDAGVVILDVVEGSPAAEAGLEPGDLLVEMDGEALETSEDLLAALRGRARGRGRADAGPRRRGDDRRGELGDVPQPAG